jgi:hypothetical protein
MASITGFFAALGIFWPYREILAAGLQSLFS